MNWHLDSVHHYDLYRIKEVSQLDALRLSEVWLSDAVIIEWAENLPIEKRPQMWIEVSIKNCRAESTRLISIQMKQK